MLNQVSDEEVYVQKQQCTQEMEGSYLIPAAVLPLENTDHCQDDCKDQGQEAGYSCRYSNHPVLILTHKDR